MLGFTYNSNITLVVASLKDGRQQVLPRLYTHAPPHIQTGCLIPRLCAYLSDFFEQQNAAKVMF